MICDWQETCTKRTATSLISNKVPLNHIDVPLRVTVLFPFTSNETATKKAKIAITNYQKPTPSLNRRKLLAFLISKENEKSAYGTNHFQTLKKISSGEVSADVFRIKKEYFPQKVDIGGKCISYKPYRWVQFSNTKNLFYSQKRNLTISYRTLSLKNRVMWMSLFKIFSTYQILKQMVKNEEDFEWRKTLKFFK